MKTAEQDDTTARRHRGERPEREATQGTRSRAPTRVLAATLLAIALTSTQADIEAGLDAATHENWTECARQMARVQATHGATKYARALYWEARCERSAGRRRQAAQAMQRLLALPEWTSWHTAMAWERARGRRGRTTAPEAMIAHAVRQVESNGHTEAVSPKGAIGWMQIMPDTAKLIGARYGFSEIQSLHCIHEPECNLRMGWAELKAQHERFGDWIAALVAYNAGPGRVRWLGDRPEGRPKGDPVLAVERIPVRETREYVPKVLLTLWKAQDENGQRSASRQALANGRWPRRP